MHNKRTVIITRYPEFVHDGEIEAIVDGLRVARIPVVTYDETAEQIAAIEWAIPALVGIVIAHPFYKGFMEELGKRTAGGLADRLSSLVHRLNGKQKRWHTEDSRDTRSSPLLSITIDTGHPVVIDGVPEQLNLKLRFVVPYGVGSCGETEYADAFRTMEQQVQDEICWQADDWLLKRGFGMYGYDSIKGIWIPDHERIERTSRRVMIDRLLANDGKLGEGGH